MFDQSKKFYFTSTFLLMCLFFLNACAASPLILVDQSKAKVCIVTGEKISKVEQYAVCELQKAFKLACGAAVEVNPEKICPATIRIGVAQSPLKNKSKQAYAIKRDGSVISITGNSPASTMWGVMDFMWRVLKVGTPVIGPLRRAGDLQATLKIDELDVADAPDMEFRGWFHSDFSGAKMNWMANNRYNIDGAHFDHFQKIQPLLASRGVDVNVNLHSFFWLIPDELFDTHPEYFPLLDGKRVRANTGISANFCVSNPDVAEIIIEKAKATFRKYPEVIIFPLVPNDSPIWCECDECKKWDGNAKKGVHTNRLVRLANKVADATSKEFPDRYIGILGYSNFIDPPEMRVSPNIAVGICPMKRNSGVSLFDEDNELNRGNLEKIKAWTDSGAGYVYLWEYYGYVELKECPPPIGRAIAEEYGELVKMGVKGVLSEPSYVVPELMDLVGYVMARSSWDSSLGYDEILNDYCELMYGPAAQVMKKYHLGYEKAVKNIVELIAYPGDYQGVLGNISPEVWKTLDGFITQAELQVNKSSDDLAKKSVAYERGLLKKMMAHSTPVTTIPGIGKNLLDNPGAEEGTTGIGWFMNVQRGDYKLAIDQTVAKSGKQSFRISCDGKDGWARWAQSSVSVTKGKRYALSAWARGKSGKLLIWQGGLTTKAHQAWQGSSDEWKLVIIPEITAVSDQMLICLETYGEGDVYYDDVFFAELPDTK